MPDTPARKDQIDVPTPWGTARVTVYDGPRRDTKSIAHVDVTGLVVNRIPLYGGGSVYRQPHAHDRLSWEYRDQYIRRTDNRDKGIPEGTGRILRDDLLALIEPVLSSPAGVLARRHAERRALAELKQRASGEVSALMEQLNQARIAERCAQDALLEYDRRNPYLR